MNISIKAQVITLSAMLKKMVKEGHNRADYTLGARVRINK